MAGPERVAKAHQNGVIAMDSPAVLIRDLYTKVEQFPAERRSSALRHLTDLYLIGGEQLSTDDIAHLDEVFVRLVETVEVSARALLATRLGPAATAPPKVLRLLACDNAIEVASPVLTQAAGLDDNTLIECARTRGQDHMLAISRRRTLSESVTDVLVEHGDRDVVLSTAMNAGASFSEKGFGILVNRAKGYDELASYVGRRRDLPPAFFERLLEAASEVVRAKLKAERPHVAAEIDRAVVDVAEILRGQAVAQSYAQSVAQSLNRTGKLNEAKLMEFVSTGHTELLAVALAQVASLPEKAVADMLDGQHDETLIILAKAIELSWETTKTIIASIAHVHPLGPSDFKRLNRAFDRLEQATAQKILDFRDTQARRNSAN